MHPSVTLPELGELTPRLRPRRRCTASRRRLATANAVARAHAIVRFDYGREISAGREIRLEFVEGGGGLADLLNCARCVAFLDEGRSGVG